METCGTEVFFANIRIWAAIFLGFLAAAGGRRQTPQKDTALYAAIPRSSCLIAAGFPLLSLLRYPGFTESFPIRCGAGFNIEIS